LEYVSTELWKQFPPETTRFDELPWEARNHAWPVASFFTMVGALVSNGMVSDLMMASYMGASVLRAWTHLEPYIRNERRWRGDPNWHLFFEHLAFRVSTYSPAKINEALNLERMPDSFTRTAGDSPASEKDDST
jgi:hypothetical protein